MKDQASSSLNRRHAFSRSLLPVGLWALYMGFVYFTISGWEETPLITWGFAAKDTLAAIAGYYFFSMVVLPHFLLRRRWLLTALGLVAIYYCWALISYAFYLGLDSAGLLSKTLYGYAHRVLDKGLWVGVFSWYGVSIGLNDFGFTILPPFCCASCNSCSPPATRACAWSAKT